MNTNKTLNICSADSYKHSWSWKEPAPTNKSTSAFACWVASSHTFCYLSGSSPNRKRCIHVSLQEKASQAPSGKSNGVDMKIKKSLGIQGWSDSSALRKQTIRMVFLDGSELCHTVTQTSFSSKALGSQRGHPTPARRLTLPMVEVNRRCLHRHAGRAAVLQSVTLLEITLVYWASKPWENEKEEPTTGIARGQGWHRGWHRLRVLCGLGEPGWLQPLPQHKPMPSQEEFKGSKPMLKEQGFGQRCFNHCRG